jgi:hypothetical protein
MPQTQMLARAERENIPARLPSLIPLPILKLLQDRGCDDSCCARHISFLEEERRALAIECDKLRVERDALKSENALLRHQLQEKAVAA